MTKLTKLALEQKNAALASENAELRKQIEDYKLRLEMSTRQLQGFKPRIVAPAPSARLQAMHLAREMAMRSGRVVKVLESPHEREKTLSLDQSAFCITV